MKNKEKRLGLFTPRSIEEWSWGYLGYQELGEGTSRNCDLDLLEGQSLAGAALSKMKLLLRVWGKVWKLELIAIKWVRSHC